MDADGPTAVTRDPCKMTVKSGFAGAPVASITVTWVMAIEAERVVEQEISAAAEMIASRTETIGRGRETGRTIRCTQHSIVRNPAGQFSCGTDYGFSRLYFLRMARN